MSNPKLSLVSFKLCPFVQRSVILLNEKQVPYELKYIDLMNKPDWLIEISPLGKVPVLLVDETPLFESSVIAEYLDETISPSLHPVDALTKGIHRAWVEYSSTLLMAQYRFLSAETDEQQEKERLVILDGLARLAEQSDQTGPFFSGKDLCLVDAAIAPLFMRLEIVIAKLPISFYPNNRVEKWVAALMRNNSIKQSVVEDFEARFCNHFGF